MNEMITSPVVVLSAIYVLLISTSIYFQHISTMAADKLDGLIYSETPAFILRKQQDRAERTATVVFFVSILVAMALVGTMEFPG